VNKHADVDHPVQEGIRKRWSPYVFVDREVTASDLRSLFEAARWAASSFNEQPWRYIVARKSDPEAFARLLSCLVPGNQEWATEAHVLALGIIRTRFTRNEKPNRVALHDLGAASAQLTMEATHRGLSVHQMAGIDPERARSLYGVPEEFLVATALAIGYAGESEAADPKFRERDEAPRRRRSLADSVFQEEWSNPAPWLEDTSPSGS
jgi:nitroreductase